MNGDARSLKNKARRLAGLFLGAFAVGLALLFVSCASVEKAVNAPPEIEGAKFVGNKACSECHTNITRVFAASPHGRFYKDNDLAFASLSGCESCHGPGSKHIAAGGGKAKFIANPGRDPKACFNCHLDVHAEFNLPQHHPVIEDRMNCVQCHDPHGHDIMKASKGLGMARLNQTCAQCHRDQARTFVFEHEALREGCATCHTPHGSVNNKMLVQRDNNLCLKCHSQVQLSGGDIFIGKENHTANLRRGTCWTSGCHTAVHGSNVSPRLRY